jgi:hypothetical protein
MMVTVLMKCNLGSFIESVELSFMFGVCTVKTNNPSSALDKKTSCSMELLKSHQVSILSGLPRQKLTQQLIAGHYSWVHHLFLEVIAETWAGYHGSFGPPGIEVLARAIIGK